MWIDKAFGSNKWYIWAETGPGDAEPIINTSFDTREEAEQYAKDHRLAIEPCPFILPEEYNGIG